VARVLVVDDDPTVREVVVSYLRAAGHQAGGFHAPKRLVHRGLADLGPEPHAPRAEPLEDAVAVQRLLGEQPEHHDLDLRHRHRDSSVLARWH